jgi:hypothetical protein
MKDKDYTLKIIQKLLENGYSIKNIEGNYITAYDKQNIEFGIGHERCMCHGGRLSISSEHCRFYKRFESDFYDETKGITDSDSELQYHIDNDLIPTIELIDKYIYKVVKKRPGYYKDKDEIEYFDTPTIIGRRLIDKEVDIFSIDEQTITHPNENVIDKIENVKFNDGRLEFDKFRYERKDKKDEFVKKEDDFNLEHYIVSVIRKS